MIQIDRTLNIPLIRQVYEQIRLSILNGWIVAGERLPSTRELASSLGISRNVILEAYEQLIVEGYIEGRKGSGTYVAEGTFLNLSTMENYNPLYEQQLNKEIEDIIDFRSGLPALDMFPRNAWGKIAKEVCIDTTHAIFGYDYPEGRAELRYIVSDYLNRTRQVLCHPDQLVITSGATQALSLISNLLLSPGDEVIIEDPITNEIQTIFSSQGSILYPIPVDEQGMRTDLIPLTRKPKFIFVTPSHQFPLGGTLPIQRRIQLIQFARTNDCFIVEDDYDSEFRYQGVPVSSLQGLDPERVIYIGTFSKILSPALRLGYLILPPSLIEQGKNLKWYTDLHTPSLEQLTLAKFINEGRLEQHVKKMKRIYKIRRDYLKSCLLEEFGDNVKISGDTTGLHLIAVFNNIEFSAQKVAEILGVYKVKVYPIEPHTIRKNLHQNKLILGYGNLTKEEIKKGVTRLKQALIDAYVKSI